MLTKVASFGSKDGSEMIAAPKFFKSNIFKRLEN
jgi:hypothetical protein